MPPPRAKAKESRLWTSVRVRARTGFSPSSRSSTLTPRARARGTSRGTSGYPPADSQREMLLLLTPRASASSCWVMFFSLR